MKFPVIVLAILVPAQALAASGFETRSATPEYSGPMAHIENRGMEDAGDPQIVRTPYGENFSNDYNVELENTRRNDRVQSEMDRRRDEIIRANQEHILKLNE